MPTVKTRGDRPIELYYERSGPPGVDPVLLVMGLGTTLDAWDLTAPVLAEKRDVIRFDNRGIGRTEKPRGRYRTAEMADDALALLDHLGLDRVHVVGISMGGMIAQELALVAPARVKSLTLLATYAAPDSEIERTAEEGAKAQGRPDLGTMFKMMASAAEAGTGPAAADAEAAATPAVDPMLILKFMMPLVVSKAYLEREREFLKRQFERSMEYGFALHGFMGQVAAVMAHDTRARLAQLATLPVHVMLGTKDRLIPPRLTRALHAGIPGARLTEIEGGTHGLCYEFAERLNQELAGWLDAPEAAPRASVA